MKSIGVQLGATPASPEMSPTTFRAVEAELAQLDYRGLPIGTTLSDALVINLLWGHGDWRRTTRWLNRALSARHLLLPRTGGAPREAVQPGRVLVTWQKSTPRIDGMLLPVLEEVGPAHCAVILASGDEVPGLPPEVPLLGWEDATSLSAREWREQYLRHRPAWSRVLKDVCRRYDLPRGAFDMLSFQLVVSSQRIERAVQLLEACRPSAVLTEYDRSYLWSCLTLAARSLGIPTVTLVHGVIRPDALGFSPVLADLVICWGESDRAKLLAAGEPPERVVIGGCPRITRDLPLTGTEAKLRLGLAADVGVALLATSPDRGHIELAELFCATLESIPWLAGVIRLHPAESPSDYAGVAQRHPSIRFMDNADATLDESLAAADVVVVRGSGVGSDALVKRRAVVVLNPGPDLTGNDWELVNVAECPLARTSAELAEILSRSSSDGVQARQPTGAAEEYVDQFCSAFGQDSARLIGETVKRIAAGTRESG